MKSWKSLFLCLLALIGLVQGTSSSAAGSSAIGLLDSRAINLVSGSPICCLPLRACADANDPLPDGVSSITPLFVAQAVTEGPRFAVESVLEPVTMAITRIKRMRSIDELGLCLEQVAGVSARRNWGVAESSRDWLEQVSLLTLSIRLQV